MQENHKNSKDKEKRRGEEKEGKGKKGRRRGGGEEKEPKQAQRLEQKQMKSKWVGPTKSWLFKMIKLTHPLLD